MKNTLYLSNILIGQVPVLSVPSFDSLKNNVEFC